jgi:hypothetical protein
MTESALPLAFGACFSIPWTWASTRVVQTMLSGSADWRWPRTAGA